MRLAGALSGLLIAQWVTAQDTHFSQFNQAPLWLNPAAPAMKSELQLNMNYRSQWASIIKPFATAHLSLMYPLVRRQDQVRRAGLGLSLISDKAGNAGIMQTNGIGASFAWNQPLTHKHFIAFGANGGYLQKNISIDGLTAENQWVEGDFQVNAGLGESFGDTRVDNLDVGGGLLWYLESDDGAMKASAGLAFHHLNKQQVSYLHQAGDLPLRIGLYAMANIFTNDQVDVMPAFYYARMAKAQELNVGAQFRYKPNTYGLLKNGAFGLLTAYRTGDAVILGIQIDYPGFSVGFSYDINISPLSVATSGRGASEIALVLRKPVVRKQREKPDKPEIAREPEEKPTEVEEIPEEEIPETREPEEAVPINLSGMVRDAWNGKTLEARLVVKDPRSGEVIADLSTAEDTGHFSIQIPSGRSYIIEATQAGYHPVNVAIDIPEDPVEREITRDIGLEPDASILEDHLRFGFNQTTLDAENQEVSARMTAFLKKYPELKLQIIGHTDNRGSDAVNDRISMNRALTVERLLVEKGVDKARIRTIGMGERSPIADNQTEEGRNRNRRVEVRIIK